MRKVVVTILSYLGRYGTLLLVPPVAVLFWAAAELLEIRPGIGLVVFVPAALIALATLVLVLGILLSGHARPRGISLSREEAPEIWNYWDRSSPPGSWTRRQILVDDQINAAMGEQSRFAGFFGRDQTLYVGLGLLIVLDRPSVEAVFEHEFAHADRKHSHGLTRLGEFVNTYGTFEDLIEHLMPAVAFVLELAFRLFDLIVKPEFLRRSWQHEFEADKQSAERIGTDIEANTQMLLEGSAKLAEQLVYEPLEEEILGSVSAPKPPLDRLLEQREELTNPQNLQIAVDEIFSKDEDPESTHPPLRQRLLAIGANLDRSIQKPGPPAYQYFLSEEGWKAASSKLNDQWISHVNDRVMLE